MFRPARFRARQNLLDQLTGLGQKCVVIAAEWPQDELRHAGVDIFGDAREYRVGVADRERVAGVTSGTFGVGIHRPADTGRDAMQAFAIGDADTILARIAEYVDAGVSKFILRPLGGDDDALLAQTRLLIEQVLPRAEARWPKRPKTSDR